MHSHVAKSDQGFSAYSDGCTGSQLKLPPSVEDVCVCMYIYVYIVDPYI